MSDEELLKEGLLVKLPPEEEDLAACWATTRLARGKTNGGDRSGETVVEGPRLQ